MEKQETICKICKETYQAPVYKSGQLGYHCVYRRFVQCVDCDETGHGKKFMSDHEGHTWQQVVGYQRTYPGNSYKNPAAKVSIVDVLPAPSPIAR